jgi:GH24 family phage-related lysozyme (muramidase)
VAYAEHAVEHLVTVLLNEDQYDALCSFVYNEGAGAAADFDDVEGAERGELRGGTGPADGEGVRRWGEAAGTGDEA